MLFVGRFFSFNLEVNTYDDFFDSPSSLIILLSSSCLKSRGNSSYPTTSLNLTTHHPCQKIFVCDTRAFCLPFLLCPFTLTQNSSQNRIVFVELEPYHRYSKYQTMSLTLCPYAITFFPIFTNYVRNPCCRDIQARCQNAIRKCSV